MKRNTFYILTSLLGILLVGIFWGAVNYDRPPAMAAMCVSVLVCAIAVILLRNRIDDARASDELLAKINEKSSLRTLQIVCAVFFAFSVSSLGMALSISDHHVSRMIMHAVIMQFVFLAAIFLIYAGFSIYYSKKYGGCDADEESD